jgi:hypothetical protein
MMVPVMPGRGRGPRRDLDRVPVAGRTHARTHGLLLSRDRHIRIINAATGELLRDLDLDPTRDYQPPSQPPGPKPRTP